MKGIFLVLAVTLGFGSFYGSGGYAHEGHDKMPGAVQAPHGGTVKGTSQLYIELVNEPSGIKLYPLTHEMTPVALKDVTIAGTAEAPKKKKETVKFTNTDDHFEAKVDAKGAYRYTLELMTTYKGKKEKITFQVEPQN